ncbi:MAG: T9SS type A sorting domain-containing protein [Bacteroidales bacterium]
MVDGSFSIKNSIISHNELLTGYLLRGGGIDCYNLTTQSNIENSTIAYNSHEGLNFEDGTNNVINTIVWGNNSSQISGSAIVTYSDIQDGFSGDGNINLNPIFNSDTDLHIVPGSPCVDAGNPDPIYYDECFPPSQETELNDMGVDGGPLGCNWIITDVIENTIEIDQVVVIYPNPSSTETNIEFSNSDRNNFELSILSVSGKQVFTSENINSDKIVIKRNGLPKGVYFVKLTSEKKQCDL